MAARAAFLRVGLFIVLGAAAVLAVILFLSGDALKRGRLFESYFSESVQGLEVGAPVKYRGVSLGRVSAIGLVSAEYGRDSPPAMSAEDYQLVYVRFNIDPARIGRVPDAATAAATGLRARVASQGITGLSYIELDFVDPDQFPARKIPWVPSAEYISSMPSTLAQVQDAAQQLLAKLNKIDIEHLISGLTGLVDDVRRSVKEGEVHQVLVRLDSVLAAIQSNVTDGEIRNTLRKINELVAAVQSAVERSDVPAIAADLRATTGAVRGMVEGKELRAMMTSAATAADRFAQAAVQLRPTIAALETTIRRAGDGTADLQQALVPLLRDILAVAANLREVTDTLRQYPAGTILGGPPPRAPERPR